MRFDPKVSAVEEREDIDSIRMDELHGIFTAYEMRTEHENPDIKKQLSKNPKDQSKRGKKEEEHSSSSDISEDD
jgi:hypothetical protein